MKRVLFNPPVFSISHGRFLWTQQPTSLARPDGAVEVGGYVARQGRGRRTPILDLGLGIRIRSGDTEWVLEHGHELTLPNGLRLLPGPRV